MHIRYPIRPVTTIRWTHRFPNRPGVHDVNSHIRRQLCRRRATRTARQGARARARLPVARAMGAGQQKQVTDVADVCCCCLLPRHGTGRRACHTTRRLTGVAGRRGVNGRAGRVPFPGSGFPAPWTPAARLCQGRFAGAALQPAPAAGVPLARSGQRATRRGDTNARFPSTRTRGRRRTSARLDGSCPCARARASSGRGGDGGVTTISQDNGGEQSAAVLLTVAEADEQE
jgi:hypothetical protein